MSRVSSIQYAGLPDGDGDPELVYYNGSIINNKTQIDTGYDPGVRFIETRDIPLVKDASKYQFSIVRFTMNGPNKDLPLFIPSIRTGAANPTNNVNLTIYSVAVDFTFNGTTYGGGAPALTTTFTSTQPVIYSPETLDTTVAPVPASTTAQTGQDISTRYYWVYTYSWWLQLVQAALDATTADIQAQFAVWWAANGGVGPAPTLAYEPPTLTYNPSNNLFSIYAPANTFGPLPTATGQTSKLYFNENLYGMFANFKNIYQNLSGERTNEILIENILYQNLITVPANFYSAGVPAVQTKYWVMTQDYESTSTLWSPIESIVFTSGLLPVVNEATSDPIRFGNSNDTVLQTTISAFQPIITDVAIPLSSASGYRDFIEYAPTAEYRMASMGRSKTAINNVDIQVYWKHRLTGTLFPVQMFNGSSVSIKILLRRVE